MEGVAPPHCFTCSLWQTLERTESKINANKCKKFV